MYTLFYKLFLTGQLILKFIWKNKHPRIALKVLKNNKKMSICPLDIKHLNVSYPLLAIRWAQDISQASAVWINSISAQFSVTWLLTLGKFLSSLDSKISIHMCKIYLQWCSQISLLGNFKIIVSKVWSWELAASVSPENKLEMQISGTASELLNQ
jgi:hypothetical protein